MKHTRRIAILLPFFLSLASFSSAQPQPFQVVDAATGVAIPDATVVANGQALHRNEAGGYDIEADSGTLFARAPGYRAGSFDLGRLPRNGRLPLVRFAPHAVYLSVYGAGSRLLLDNVLSLARSGAINAVVVDVKGDSGLIPYPSAVPMASQSGARRFTFIPDLAGFVRMLHERGLYAIARIVTFKDNPLASSNPALAVHFQNGALYRDREGMAWTDPFQPQVQAYNLGIAVEAARAGFDEIQFDYLRFPDASEQLEFAKPVSQQSRIAAISGFLAAARQRLLPYNVYLAADVFGYVCWNRDDTGIGQTLAAIAPNVDYISPMLYPSGFQFGIPGYPDPVAHAYNIVYLSLTEAQERLAIPPLRFRPWLQAFKDYAFDRRDFAAQEVAEQIQAAADFGADGWMLWNPRNDYSKTGLGPPQTTASTPRAGLPPVSACS